MVVEDFLTVYMIAIFLVMALPPLAFIVYAIVNFSRSSRAAVMVMIGSALIFVSSFGGRVFTAWFVSRLSATEIGTYIPLIQLVEVSLGMAGIAVIVFAVFVDRNQLVAEVVSSDQKTQDSSNPYRAPVE